MNKKRVLVACEFSGVVREAFKAHGWNAWSCDILPTEIPGQHLQCNVLDILDEGWDMMIAHPPCTYLTVSGNRWMKPEYKDRFPDRQQHRAEALLFVKQLMGSSIEKIAIENPIGIISSHIRKPEQIIQPFQFGEPHAKQTCLWLKNLPKLVPTKVVEPQYYIYKDGRRDPLWHMETMKLKPLERMKERSRTFKGIADAMAEQWTDYINNL